MLIAYDLEGRKLDKVQKAIERLKAFEPKDGYFVAFSGGKDSQCVYHLCQMAGVKFDAHYSVTSVDPPELVRFIKSQYPDVSIDVPKDKDGKQISMWSLIPQKLMPPTRLVRYCCAKMKECNGKGRVTVTGVRWAESANRSENQALVTLASKTSELQKAAQATGAEAKTNKHGGLILNDDNDHARRMVEMCYRTHKTLVNPIIDWEDDDVWEFLNDVAKVPHCCLYDQGFKRLGCIGCPMGGPAQQGRDFERWPKYKNLYLIAFEKMVQERKKKKGADDRMTYFTDAQAVMDWWLGKKVSGKIEGQISMDDIEA